MFLSSLSETKPVNLLLRRTRVTIGSPNANLIEVGSHNSLSGIFNAGTPVKPFGLCSETGEAYNGMIHLTINFHRGEGYSVEKQTVFSFANNDGGLHWNVVSLSMGRGCTSINIS